MIPKSDKPTLIDVARAANVSLKTASRVLNSSPGIAPATAKQVRAVMERIGYRPNELARGLKGKRSAAIGMVVPNLADPFSAAAVKAVQEIARNNRHMVMITSSGGDEDLEREELESLVRRQIDGLIIAPADGRRNTVDAVISAGIPVVCFDRPFDGTAIDSVTVTNRAAAREATEHLISHGYRRILAIGARSKLYTGAERLAGYLNAVNRAKLKPMTHLVDNESELTPPVIRSLLESGLKNRAGGVDAVLTFNGLTTIVLLRALRQLGLRLGTDVPLISFDDFELAEVVVPGLTVVQQPTVELGLRAAERLFAKIQSQSPLPHQNLVLSTTLHIRGSCGCPDQ